MKNLFLFALLTCICACNSPKTTQMSVPNFDWQGHRGARGLLPENTIPAFLKAMELGVTTLELDLAISADNQLIVSHEPWFSELISSKPDGSAVTKAEAEQLLLYKMTAAEIAMYDVGKRGNERFKEQQKMAVQKPTFAAVVAAVRTWCKTHGKALPYFNIEIKSQPDWDNVRHPAVKDFAALTYKSIQILKLQKNVCVQSFDARALEAIHALDDTIMTAWLIESQGTLEQNLAKLTFQPNIYSPYFLLLTEEIVKKCHEIGIKVIPWTVNDVAQMQRFKTMGVDGIITDYPNLISQF
jgi:glycerophosphoryl diester phosphodiesterase